uniref:Putative carboxypeptidase inhibitor n=1 Tax=Rhipicephalus microplus TaxID=6941 RepID=A0A6G5A872_RHIMP
MRALTLLCLFCLIIDVIAFRFPLICHLFGKKCVPKADCPTENVSWILGCGAKSVCCNTAKMPFCSTLGGTCQAVCGGNIQRNVTCSGIKTCCIYTSKSNQATASNHVRRHSNKFIRNGFE